MQLSNLILLAVISLCGSRALLGGELQATSNAAMPTEIVSLGGVSIQSAHAKLDGNHVAVTGYVQRKFGYSYPGPTYSHLDLIVLDAKGRSLSKSPVNYQQRPIPANYRGRIGRSSYAKYLPAHPAAAKIRVLHHEAPIEGCGNAFRDPAKSSKP